MFGRIGCCSAMHEFDLPPEIHGATRVWSEELGAERGFPVGQGKRRDAVLRRFGDVYNEPA